ncbi:MAG: methyltransferase domain-containing protein [Chloroflexaceae bacterium]|nr:methyltransferase domain-containing protein [Chloroflexaceae bacterium]
MNEEQDNQFLKTKDKIGALLAKQQPISLELGAGDKKGRDGWKTLDLNPECDFPWDLRQGLPFPDASITKIYSSHFLEHLSYREGQVLLEECLRVLIPGGIFSVCVPNARLYLEAYLSGKALDPSQYFRYPPAYNNVSPIDYVNYVAYLDGDHKYMFDQENLVKILADKGFRNVHLRAFDPKLDIPERDIQSIYAEGQK